MNAAERLTLHARIVGDIEQQILTGEWPPGARIPFEHELATKYGCSRMTVSKALTQLTNAGLIERRRKVGGIVARTPSRSAVLEIADVRSEVAALGLPYRFEVLARRRRRGKAADSRRLLGVGSGPVLDLTCRHFAGALPFCLEERLINLIAAPEAAGETFADIAPGPWLLARAPWTTAEHRIRARAAAPPSAALLDIPDNSACLVVERRTWSGDMAITHVTLTYPSQMHELIARFSPGQR